MKFLLLTILLSISIVAETFTVTATVDGKGFKAKKKAKKIAKKNAIEKYILNKNKNINTDTLSEISSAYPDYIIDTILQDKSYENSQTTIVYSVEIDDEAINNKLVSLGQSINGLATKFIILEEPLDLSSIESIDKEDFIIYYQTLQKSINDIIAEKMDRSGFEISNIQDNEKFEHLKDKNENLTGVYFNYEKDKYVQYKSFEKLVKKEYKDSIAIKYRLKSLSQDGTDITAAISFKLLDIATNKTVPIGSRSYTIHMDGTGFNSIKQSFNKAITSATALKLNTVSKRINKMLEQRNNQPVTVAITIYDTKNKSANQLSYKLKKEFKSKSTVFDLIKRDNTIKFHVKSDDAEDVLYELIIPIIEDKFEIVLDENSVEINGKQLKVETRGKKIKNIFI